MKSYLIITASFLLNKNNNLKENNRDIIYLFIYLRNLQNRLSAIIYRGVIRVFIFRTITQNLYLNGNPLTYTYM